MKIVQVIPAVSSNFGGPSTGSIALNKALNSIGVRATLFATDAASDGRHRLERAERKDLEATPGAVLQLFDAGRPFRLYSSGLLRKALREAIRDSDAVHIHGQYLAPCVYAYMYATRWGRPFGVQLHGALEEFHRRKGRIRKSIYNFLIGDRILRRASYVMCASESERETALTVQQSLRPVVIPLGVDLPRPVRTGRIDEMFAGLERGSCAVFLGRLTEKKQPHLLIDAWSRASRPSNSKLFIVGPDGDVTSKELQSYARRKNVERSVVVTGPADGSEKSYILSRSGVMILPSLSENFGLTVVEGMAAGCHVVATSAVASSSYLIDAGTGTVLKSPTSAEAIGAAIETFFADPSRFLAVAAEGARYADEWLTWGGVAKSLSDRLRVEIERHLKEGS